MSISQPEQRLNMFWGLVDQKHIQTIVAHLKKGSVLDMGCGMGSTTNQLNKTEGIECTGIDLSEGELAKAEKLFPGNNYQVADAEKLPFDDHSFDNLVLRDALHHFYEEADFSKVRSEMVRVLKPGGRLIFFDPNVNFMLRALRKIAGHQDAECTFEEALREVDNMKFDLQKTAFNTIFTLPLSGGYVSKSYLPNVRALHKMAISLENALEKAINALALGRYFCIRYLIVAEKPAR